jgi:integrase/recombinase XerD
MELTLATLATEFLSRPGLSQSTVRSYECTLLPLLQQQGAIPVSELSRDRLEQYLDSLAHLSYSTQNRHQATRQSLLNFAVVRQYLSANPPFPAEVDFMQYTEQELAEEMSHVD